MNTPPPCWQPEIDLLASRMGDSHAEESLKFLTERSPLTHVDRVSKPLLIGHGANDPRVKQAKANQIAEAMQQKEIPVICALYPDNGHGFAQQENVLSFCAVCEGFPARYLVEHYEAAAPTRCPICSKAMAG